MSEDLSKLPAYNRKILAILDNSPECDRAVAYAAAQARRQQNGLILLYVTDDSDFRQMFGVERVMRAEAAENAKRAVDMAVAEVLLNYGVTAETVIREGQAIEEIAALVAADGNIALLVLAAGSSADNPGPLIQALLSRPKYFPLPVTIIPANLDDSAIDALA